jgi:hypothetical protein
MESTITITFKVNPQTQMDSILAMYGALLSVDQQIGKTTEATTAFENALLSQLGIEHFQAIKQLLLKQFESYNNSNAKNEIEQMAANNLKDFKLQFTS